MAWFAHMLAVYSVMSLSGVLMKAHAVSQTAGGTVCGDVHLGRSVLTTSINHQSNFVSLLC